MLKPMPRHLYEDDILLWSEQQADRLRRLAQGERVNDLDWEHLVQEVEDLGLSELNAVRSHLRLMLVHLLKIVGWPDDQAVGHWRSEAISFQADAQNRFSPSMRQRIDLPAIYRKALEQIDAMRIGGQPAQPSWPAACPATLDELLSEPVAVLEGRLRGQPDSASA